MVIGNLEIIASLASGGVGSVSLSKCASRLWLRFLDSAALVGLLLLSGFFLAADYCTGAGIDYANLPYSCHDRQFVILATKGRHKFFEEEQNAIRDIRRVPLKYAGYSISYRREGQIRPGASQPKWHAHIAIERERYLELKAHFLDLATHRSAEKLALMFYRLPYDPYAPIRRQMPNILRAVNKIRKQTGYSKIPTEVLPLRRRVVKPFAGTRVTGGKLSFGVEGGMHRGGGRLRYSSAAESAKFG